MIKLILTIIIWKNITYVDNYRINDNSNWNIKLWNKTLIKYQEHFKNNNFQLQNTLLFNFIQNYAITIEREFGETLFNDFMKEEQTFIHACNEILNIKNNKKVTWEMIKHIWTKIEIEPMKVKQTAERPRVKPPGNKEQQPADEGEPSMPEQKNKNKEELFIEHEHIYERNKLLKYNTSALTQNLDPSYNVINTQDCLLFLSC